MLNIRKAELNDVDMLLDMKLDIILSSEEIAELDKRELEKIVILAKAVNMYERYLIQPDKTACPCARESQKPVLHPRHLESGTSHLRHHGAMSHLH